MNDIRIISAPNYSNNAIGNYRNWDSYYNAHMVMVLESGKFLDKIGIPTSAVFE